MDLKDLEIYSLARDISPIAWKIYNQLDWRVKRTMGDQFISAIDSIGANIAEGFGRFHYLDRNKFNYNARGSLCESLYWSDLLFERGFVGTKLHDDFLLKLRRLMVKLNNYISATKLLGGKK